MILSHAHDPEESRAYNFCVHSARTGGFGSLAPWCLLLGIGMNFFSISWFGEGDLIRRLDNVYIDIYIFFQFYNKCMYST